MKNLKVKLIPLFLLFILPFSACGFGGMMPGLSSASGQTSSIRIDESTSTVELTLPKDYVESATQEELDAAAEEMGYQSITLQDDGSVIYTMTMEQHEQMLADIGKHIRAGLESMKDSKDYDNFTDITANDDFTEFTVITTAGRLDTAESFSVMSFYMYGQMYNTFKGTPGANIHVVFLNSETGEVVSTADSSGMNKK